VTPPGYRYQGLERQFAEAPREVGVRRRIDQIGQKFADSAASSVTKIGRRL